MLDIILNLIYPPVCGICGKLDKNLICKRCENKIKKQAVYEIDDYSKDNYKYFDEHLYLFMYNDIIRKTILNYKFNNMAYLYKTFVKILLKNEKIVEIIKSYDIIIPIPLSVQRKKERGYNQSELIAMEIAHLLNKKTYKNIVIKTKNTIAQSSLNKEERHKNIQGVYKLKNSKKVQNKKVLIVDDIYTTGNTVNECSKIVSNASTKKIGVLTIAKD